VIEGLKVNPGETSVPVFLGGQNIGYKVVPMKEPLAPKCVQDIKDRWPIMTSVHRGQGRGARSRGGRGSHLGPFRGVRD